MELQEALALIRNEKIIDNKKQNWYDLGAGAGTFTIALAHFLCDGSKIVAIDENNTALQKIPSHINQTVIETITKDFTSSDLPYSNFDGILMANSLHYVKNKSLLIERISKHLKAEHYFIIVEYDTETSNRWVPYPTNFSSLVLLFTKLGYHSIEKIGEKKSRYNAGKMYAALICR